VRFEVLTPEDEAEAAKLGFLFGLGKINAPYCIIGICDNDLGMQELGFALEQEVLKLTSAGYGTCWFGTFDRKTLNVKLNIKENERISVAVAFGAFCGLWFLMVNCIFKFRQCKISNVMPTYLFI
jgi:nitroreductase